MQRPRMKKAAQFAPNPPQPAINSADLTEALESALIFITLLIAVGAALYILNGQIIRLV